MDPATKHLLELAENAMTNLMEVEQKKTEVVIDGLTSIIESLLSSIEALEKTIENIADITGKSLRGEINGTHHSRDIVETLIQQWVVASKKLVDDCRELTAPVIRR